MDDQKKASKISDGVACVIFVLMGAAIASLLLWKFDYITSPERGTYGKVAQKNIEVFCKKPKNFSRHVNGAKICQPYDFVLIAKDYKGEETIYIGKEKIKANFPKPK